MKTVVLIRTGSGALRSRRGYGDIPVGTLGEIIAARKLDGDPEECFLVKFNGQGGLRHVTKSWLKEG